MADDEVKEQGQQTISSSVMTIGEAAAAIGAGAAFLYRIGGEEMAADRVNRLYRFFSGVSDDMKYGPEQRSISEWITSAKDQWKDSKLNPGQTGADFLFDSRHSTILDSFIRANDLLNDRPDASVRQHFIDTYILSPILNDPELKQLPKDVEYQLRELIPRLVNQIDNPAAIAREKNNITGPLRNEMTVVDNIIQKIRKLSSEHDYSKYLKSPESKKDFDAYREFYLKQIFDPEQLKKMRKQSTLSRVLRGESSHAITIGELLEHKDLFTENKVFRHVNGQYASEHVADAVENVLQEAEKLNPELRKQLEAVPIEGLGIRVDTATGRIYSLKGINEIRDKIMDAFADIMPGRLLKARSFQYNNTQPAEYLIRTGSSDKLIAWYQGSTTGRTLRDVRIINNEFYEFGEDSQWHKIEGASDRWHLENARTGFIGQKYREMMDMTPRYAKARGGRIRQFFDIAQQPKMYDPGVDMTEIELHDGMQRDRIKMHTLESEIRGDNLDYFLNIQQDAAKKLEFLSYRVEDDRKLIDELALRATGFFRFLNRSTYAPDADIMKEFAKDFGTTRTMRNLFSALRTSDLERAVPILERNFSSDSMEDSFLNHDLTWQIHSYTQDPKNFILNQRQTKIDRASLDSNTTEVLTAKELFRQEIKREIMLQAAFQSKYSYSDLMSYLDSLKDRGIEEKRIIEAKRFFTVSYLQQHTELSSSLDKGLFDKNADQLLKDLGKLFNSLNMDTRDNRIMRNTIIDLANLRSSEQTKYIDFDPDAISGERTGQYIVVNNVTTPLNYRKQKVAQESLVSESMRRMNQSIKDGNPLWTSIKNDPLLMQFMANQNHPERFGYASAIPHFFLSRLNDALNNFNLKSWFGVSLPFMPNMTLQLGISKGTDSFSGLAKGLLLKRALPIAVGITALDYINDTQRETTGKSSLEAIESGGANLTLLAKRVTDTLGLTSWLKKVKEASPIWQYASGDYTPYQSEDEYRHWLQTGYEPMRRGRYWLFGSANEFRGGEISYWRANMLRRETADAYDISMYGTYDNKWSHSLLPTPTHPLSPLMAVLDPYYLERMHYNDRPYPVTGPFFQEGTPWGAFLNPTLGELIKPVRDMHRGRMIGGIDARAMLYVMNRATKEKASSQDNENYFVIQNGKIQPMDFMAYNAPTDTERILTEQYRNGKLANILSAEPGRYEGGVAIRDYEQNVNPRDSIMFTQTSPPGEPLQLTSDTPGNTQNPYQSTVPELTFKERLLIKAGLSKQNAARAAYNILYRTREMNQDIKDKAAIKDTNDGIHLDASQGMFIPSKIRYERSEIQEQIDKENDIEDALHSRQGMGFVHDMATTTRMVSGIYGWMAQGVLGDFGETNRPHIANSQDMTGFTRRFWDQDMGGIGGDAMEIIRRVIPNYGRYTAINPLMNTMPDWMPENLRYGDPYSKLPNGEERLPGRGYESLNRLHPDAFGQYGALDRMKILGDVAPFSAEYKFWKKIAAKTAQTPEDKAEFKEIRDRVNKVSSHHDFYDYKFVGRGVDYSKAVVSEVLNRGKFKIIGSDEIYTMAGITVQNVNQQGTDVTLAQYLRPGQEINLGIDSNDAYQHVKDTTNSVSATVWVDGQNINEQMVNEGAAIYKKSDTSSAAMIGRYGIGVRAIGYVSELIGHANIPFIHSQWLRIDSPLESYKNNYVYGTPYQTWSDFFGTYIRPNVEQAISSPLSVGIGEGVNIVRNFIEKGEGKQVLDTANKIANKLGVTHKFTDAKDLRMAVKMAQKFGNRGSFMGDVVAFSLKLGSSGSERMRERARKIGNHIVLAGALFSSYQYSNPLFAAGTYARAGYVLADVLSKRIKVNKKLITMGSAAAGLLLWGESSKGGLHNGRSVYIPDRTKEKWAMNDYFDRLTYIKMMGLYHRAAEEAKDKEGVDVERFFRIQEKDRIAKARLKKQLERDKRTIQDTTGDKDALTVINKKLQALSSTKTILRGGSWTKSAILYKQAADATMYGLKNDASMTDILRALPQEDRDYFMEFVQERDKEKRNEILQYASPQLQRALRQMWGMNYAVPESNVSYFRRHGLPDSGWTGWRPDVRLQDVKAKTVKNEGLLFSDFGIYESAYRRPQVINAPRTQFRKGDSSQIYLMAKLKADLDGAGLSNVNVNVEPKPGPGIQIAANVLNAMPVDLRNMVTNALTSD